MAYSVRQKIVDVLVAAMEAVPNIKTARDWETLFNEDELPAISVCDTSEDDNLANNWIDAPTQMHDLNISLRIFVQDTPDDKARSLRTIIKDVKTKLKDIRELTDAGLQIRGIKPAGTAIQMRETRDQQFEIGGAEVAVQIQYITNSFED